ncbi:hypothetical protein [Nocardia stercoris]|uniref:Uncharacterized protein n=1 Tax=Nocardia stercoris TaxID=2483361 RepID=A0A3M2KZN2_9NOCA|nr:hypothetical protein [Nocardia stercoris]RMI29005.1 hypothetical protein EBN03_28155 [Nocardia stercoris]
MTDYLGIYLNDQLAMGVLWRELARRAARNNAGTEAESALNEVAHEISEDVETFRAIMDRTGVRVSRVKSTAAVAAERVGRFKPNGRVFSCSPLSRFTELEILIMGIDAKKQLWSTLRDAAGLGESLPDIDFDGLIERADRQSTMLKPWRETAGRAAFRTSS